MRAARTCAGAALLAIFMAAAARPAGAQGLVLRGVAGNAATEMSGTGHALSGTLGGPAAGDAAGLSRNLRFGFWFASLDALTGLGPVLPGIATLGPNAPNPFNPSTTITFSLPAPASLRLTVHDLRGRRVATLLDGTVPEGFHDAEWSGRDDAGRPVAAGSYFVLLQAGATRLTRKICVVK